MGRKRIDLSPGSGTPEREALENLIEINLINVGLVQSTLSRDELDNLAQRAYDRGAAAFRAAEGA